MMYALVIVFLSGSPASLELPDRYATTSACVAAAVAWRAANTSRQVLSSYCKLVTASTPTSPPVVVPPPPPAIDPNIEVTPSLSVDGLVFLRGQDGSILLANGNSRLLAK